MSGKTPNPWAELRAMLEKQRTQYRKFLELMKKKEKALIKGNTKNIQRFVKEKKIQSGMILFLGALREGKFITAPKDPTIPPGPPFVEEAKDAWETFGIGTVYPNEGDPQIHIHASAGRKNEVITGCLREKSKTYLVIEAIILEFVGLGAERVLDENTGLSLLTLERKFP